MLIAVLAFLLVALASAILALVRHYRQRIRLSRAIAAQAVCAQWNPPAARATVVVLGDSTAVGVGARDPCESVAGRIAKAFPHARILNYAVSGAYVRDVHAQLDKHGDSPADVVLIQACANDVLGTHPVAAVEADLRRAVARAAALGALVVLMPGCNFSFAPFFRPLPVTPIDWRARKIHAMIQRVAGDTAAIYVDLFHLKPTDPFFVQPQEFFCPDGLHPSGEGYRIWFEELTRRVPLGDRLGKFAAGD
jgi:lysophospholipase L1-like esterase